jgi:hypothetical protein
MHCKKIEKLLSSYAHEECSAEETKQVSEHLASCLGCRKILQEFKTLSDAAGKLEPFPLDDEHLHEFYIETLRKRTQFGMPIRKRKSRLVFKPAWTFSMVAILAVAAVILSRSSRSIHELVIRENMKASEILELESQFQNRRIRSKWIDQPIPVTRWIGLLTELQRLERRYGSVAPRLEESLERIVAETNPTPEKGIPISFKMSTFTLNQSIDYIKRIRRYQSEITLRELAALYAQVRRT